MIRLRGFSRGVEASEPVASRRAMGSRTVITRPSLALLAGPVGMGSLVLGAAWLGAAWTSPAQAEEGAPAAPLAAQPTAAQPKSPPGPKAKPDGAPGPEMHRLATPAGPGQKPGHGPADKGDTKDKDDEGKNKGKKDDKGPSSPAERANMALERARERLTQAATQVESSDAEPDAKTRAQRRAARRAFLRAQMDLRKAAGKKKDLSAEEKAALQEKLGKQMAELEASRAKRKGEREAKVKRLYGMALGHEPIHRELRRHAWRVARLERVLSVAQAADQKDASERATKLLTAENERHDKRMKQLMDLWKKAGSPKGTLPSAAAKDAKAGTTSKPGAPSASPAPGAAAPGAKPVPAAPTAPAPMEAK